MRKIIDGKFYDTATATELGYASPAGLGRSDFHWYEERLYRTARGAYFVAGEGGPASHYARSAGTNATTGGADIRALSEEEARSWVERHANDSFEEIFGPAEEA